MKKILFLFFIFLFCLVFIPDVSAQEESETLNVYLFWQKTCPHCAQEKVFLEKLKEENPDVKII